MKLVIDLLVSENQSAFIPSRSINDNILLCNEIVRGFDIKSHGPATLLKIDIHKAFDSLRWDFIISVMAKMGFPYVFVNWIHHCISTPRFSVLVNGSPATNTTSLEVIMHSLQLFESVSGLCVNSRKSLIFLSGVSEPVKASLLALIGFSLVHLPVKYLGLTLIPTRLSAHHYTPMLDLIRKRLQLWKGKLLSFAGRLELIRYVLQAFFIYWSRIYGCPWLPLPRLNLSLPLSFGKVPKAPDSFAL
ncbi:uncharacterized protein LOC122062958 [Macadamia integrifolia]|uniref:uncharacterized protein LOC122062958 n=1 Tax=Macadamia integrifolia TaxID=60698 RepID=UPI001C4EFF40|nr:uncharacterized protein LOC122062958 [Macadamia integrifolia]